MVHTHRQLALDHMDNILWLVEVQLMSTHPYQYQEAHCPLDHTDCSIKRNKQMNNSINLIDLECLPQENFKLIYTFLEDLKDNFEITQILIECLGLTTPLLNLPYFLDWACLVQFSVWFQFNFNTGLIH